MTPARSPSSDPYPERPAPLEEACAAGARDAAALHALLADWQASHPEAG